jgi:ribosomal protein L7Ae-like RNA K-turn-binding protein
MIRQFLLILTAAVLISGCAATQRPKFQFPADTRIGVLNQLEGYATHQNFSSLRIGSFSKKLNVNWQMPAYFEDKLIRTLRSDPRYTVIPMGSTEASGGINQQLDRIDEILMSDKIKPDVAGFLKTLANKHNVDVIIVIKSFRGPSAFKIDKHPIELQGYGLFTKVFLISKHAYAYANIAAVVFKTEPLNYIGSGKPINNKSPLKDFDLSADLKNLPQPEIDKLEPIIRKYADQAIVNALDEAKLISY